MEQEQAMWTSPESNSMVSATIGLAMSTLLSARPKKLEDAVSRLDSAPQRSSVASLEESLWILHSYVTDAAKREEPLDGVLVPMIEHEVRYLINYGICSSIDLLVILELPLIPFSFYQSLKYKESKYGNQAMILFNWLFQDEVIFQALATNLASIIMRKEDCYIALGWCMLVRGLVGYEIKTKQLENIGYGYCETRAIGPLSCSTLQGGFELPTRLAVATADCTLALTTALTKKDLFSNGSDEKPKQSNSNLSSLPTTWVPGEKRVKPASRCPEVSMEMNLLLWDHLDELIILVQRLIAVEEWNLLVEPLIDKLFAEPSNAIIVKFLSYISEQLADVADVVFHRILVIDGIIFYRWKSHDSEIDNPVKLAHSLFDRLSPLLIIRLLPLRVFNNLNSSLMYGVLWDQGMVLDVYMPQIVLCSFLFFSFVSVSSSFFANPDPCLLFLVRNACGICLSPIVDLTFLVHFSSVGLIFMFSAVGSIFLFVSALESGQLKTASFTSHEAVLFSMDVIIIDVMLVNISCSWAFNNLEFDDVWKLAAELSGRIHPQVLLPIIASQLEDAANAREIPKIKACLFALCTSFVLHGIRSLAVSSGLQIRGRDSIVHPAMLEINNTIETILLWPSLDGDEVSKAQHGCNDCLALMICTELQDPELFRDLTTKKSSLVRTPSWSRDAAMRNSMIMESEIRVACVQVFFSAVYHLKSAVLPYASDLLKVSLKSLTDGSDKEKVAGAKLMASLMASEAAILESIAGGLLDARTILSSILSSLDTSREVRQVCNQLLACLTSP
ncbi:hypothetical protein RHSIM_Rhsim05G0135200 [Rhododendron simsii]|uniref:ARM repeat superfamily protein n=1 Tax=Rhododendron simsii TaxID=118357 RepID=A0A834H6C7_RHOSS|nr:hypothetical protein RHSIM_Rhsim05G0135200 [Rhododendron simsii]